MSYHIRRNSKTSPHTYFREITYNWDEFSCFLLKYKISGVYIISDLNNGYIKYIGQSVDLCKRVPQSLLSKFMFESNNLNIKMILTNNDFDSYIIEAYLINKLIPSKNENIIFKDKSTLIKNIDLKVFNSAEFNLIFKQNI